MADIAVRVEGLGKRYRIGATQRGYKTLREKLNDLALLPFRAAGSSRNGHAQPSRSSDDNNPKSPVRNSQSSTLWALRDVSFEVKRGEVVGIIGRNGAGKSTLLRVLSRITEPTNGEVDIYGRVGSLLEVGTGFHPELTGRENIFLNGAILGMRRAEIVRKFDEIVAFAEIERFLDTPVKHYSSGMYMRLAFAVAAHLDPEILVVDEVLAVGDAAFQKKCLGKIGEVAREGRTVLFVSHNMTAVQSLCDRAIWLDAGRIVEDGRVRQVASNYMQAGVGSVLEQTWDDPDSAPGNEYVRLRHIRASSAENASQEITVRTPIKLEIEFWNNLPNARLNLSMSLFSMGGVRISNSFSKSAPFPKGLVRSTCFIPGNLLNDERYRIELMIVKDAAVVIYVHSDAIVFDVADVAREVEWFGKWEGVVRPTFEWEISSDESGSNLLLIQ